MIAARIALRLALAVAIALPAIQCAGAPLKYKTTGLYKDSAGREHAWSINDSHTLIWNGEPYIPVGCVFEPASTHSGAGDAELRSDLSALNSLKSKGITDVILKPSGPVTSTDPAAWQRIIDHLDSNGFTYGIQMDDGPKQPLSGYLVAPNAYRLEGPLVTTRIVCDWPDVDSAIYVVVRRYDMSVVFSGGAVVREGKVTINLPDPLDAGEILLVYPRKTLQGVGDIWSGFGEYRDRVMAFFGKLRLGPGLRFFAEPFTGKMDFTGEMTGFVPDSAAFRIGLEAHLTKRHQHEGAVNSAWGMNENLESIEDAARLVPMWTSGRGIPYAYDRASAHMYPVDTTVTQAWHDIVEFRDSSAQSYMNAIADTLKKQIADVPVIFRCESYHRVYANPFGIGGFDGLAIDAYGTGGVAEAAGRAYALAEESGKTTWYVATAAAGGDRKLPKGYPSENVLAASLDLLREAGCRGLFADLPGPTPVESGSPDAADEARQTDWLAAFAGKLDRKKLSESRPNVVWFPTLPATGAFVKRLAPDTWWLPTLRVGQTAYIGDGLAAYTLASEDRAYVWSVSGQRTITLKAGPAGAPGIAFPADAKVETRKGGQYVLQLTESPTVLRGVDLVGIFPYETAQSQIDKLAKLIPEADRQGLEVEQARAALDQAKTVLANGQPVISHGIAESNVRELERSLGTVLWAEGELSPAHNFGSPAAFPGASAGQALVLDTDAEPPLAPYTATFRFSPEVRASYEIWVAGTPPQDGSPLSFSTDETTWETLSAADGKLDVYAPQLAWYKIGSVNAFPGSQTVLFRADGRRTTDGRYGFAIDAVVLSPRPFTPNGVVKP